MAQRRRGSAGPAESSILGVQTPTHRLVPPHEWTRGHDVLAMADLVGIELDEYQRSVLLDGLGMVKVRRGGKIVEKWAAFEVLLELARQNGKSVILDLLVLTALYVWRLRRIVYSAHEGLTALEAYGRIEELIRSTPELRAETPDVCFRHGNGKEGITLLTGERVIFRTRTAGGGRGLSGDLVICDECQELRDSHVAALMPTLRARPNPQIWYAGSAGGQHSTVEGRLVARSERKEPRLAVFRWAASEDDDPADPRVWAKTNPALGTRIDPEWMAAEQRSLAPEKFAQELLSIGDYPREDGEDWVIPASSVKATTDEASTAVGPVVFAVDAKLDQSWASIGIAGRAGLVRADGTVVARPGGGIHLEPVEHLRGVRWLGARLLDLCAKHDHHAEIVMDAKGPLARLAGEFEDLGLKLRLLTPQEMADACAWTYDAMVNQPRQAFHRAPPLLISAIASSHSATTTGGFRWRRTGQADISPFYSVTMAGYVAALSMTAVPPAPPPAPRSARSATRLPSVREPRRRGPARETDLAHAGF